METYKDNKSDILKSLAIGIGISFITTIILLLIFAVVLTYTNISENTITPVILIATAISILLGSSQNK